MVIEWNKVTWYSKLAAIIVFIGTFFLGFWLGTMKAEKVHVEVPHISMVAAQKQDNNPSAPNQISTQTSSQDLVSETNSDKFSDWKTYRNEKYGFQFKYPSFESVSIDNSDPQVTFISFHNFAFSVIPKPKETTLEEWFSKNVDYKNLLITSGVFKISSYKGTPALVGTDKVTPDEYGDKQGPLYVSFYAELPAKDYILGFTIPPNDLPSELHMSSHGYDFPNWHARFQEDILSTLEFF